MPIRCLLGLFALLAYLCAQQTRFQVDVNLVNVTFTVRNLAGELVSDLTKEDFEVLEDGMRQEPKFFARKNDLPLALGLILDFSGSQAPFFKKHHRDIKAFLKDVLDPRDRVFLVCFANRIILAADLTSSVDQVMDSLTRLEMGQRDFPRLGPQVARTWGTAFYDAIFYSTQEKLAHTTGSRQALIVFSDGEDNASGHHMMDVVDVSQGTDSPLYSIRYTHRQSGGLTVRNEYGIRVMERLARETGGADFDATSGDMKPAFHQIGKELRALYEIAYAPTNSVRDGSFRKVEIKTRRPDLKIRAKTGYYSRPD